MSTQHSEDELTRRIYEAMQIPYLSERHDAIKNLIKANRAKHGREQRIASVQLYMDTCEKAGVDPSWRSIRAFQSGQHKAMGELHPEGKQL